MGFLKKVFGNEEQENRSAMSPDVVQEILQTYGKFLETHSLPPGCVADSSKLPFPKEKIKLAITIGLRIINDPQMKETLKFVYIQLADWQDGVGETQLGLDYEKIAQIADPGKMAKMILENNSVMEKWQPLIEAEKESLKNDLVRLGLW